MFPELATIGETEVVPVEPVGDVVVVAVGAVMVVGAVVVVVVAVEVVLAGEFWVTVGAIEVLEGADEVEVFVTLDITVGETDPVVRVVAATPLVELVVVVG